LGAENYDLAIHAHQNHTTVTCQGELVRFGRTNVLTNLTSFKLGPEPEEETEEETLWENARTRVKRRQGKVE
jgi:hypothetical protein